MELKGERISSEESNRREAAYRRRVWYDEYMLAVDGMNFLKDPTVYGNNYRYANHSYAPNAAFMNYVWDGSEFAVVSVVALRDVRAGEEITLDYAWCLDESNPFVI